jgi:phosphate acetyltransferase
MQVSPFKKNILDHCQASPKRVIFPEGDDSRVIQAAQYLLEWGAIKEVTLITTTNSVLKNSSDARLKSISTNDAWLLQLTSKACEISLQERGKSFDTHLLAKLARQPLFQAGALLRHNLADCAVAGCVETTADVIRAALGTVGLANGIKTVSGSFIMDRPSGDRHEVYIFADCGVVIEPTVDQLVDIAASSAETYKKLTNAEPVVAFLSFSTKGSANHPAAQKMQQAAALFKTRCPHVKSDGELQFDAAYVPDVGLRKAPSSPVPGKANCFIFPDLNAGNIAYKITQRLAGFGAYGPILQGLAKPYSDLSRGATADDIAMSAMINMIRSESI